MEVNACAKCKSLVDYCICEATPVEVEWRTPKDVPPKIMKAVSEYAQEFDLISMEYAKDMRETAASAAWAKATKWQDLQYWYGVAVGFVSAVVLFQAVK